MVQINFAQKQVNAKIVYYGPGMSGKTTNLEVIHQRAPDGNRGELTSISTDGDRTLFFDFMPLDLGTVAGMRTCFQIYTVPGQVYYNSTRKLVLQGVDGVIFVADSSPDMMEENIESMKNLEANLVEYGRAIEDLPLVIQYNKRDMPGALPIEQLEAQLNTRGAPAFEGIANTGQGVFPTLKAVAACVLDSLHKNQQSAAAPSGGDRAAEPAPASEPMAAPPAPMAAPPEPMAAPLAPVAAAPTPVAPPEAELPAAPALETAAASAQPAPTAPPDRPTISMSQTGFHRAPSLPLEEVPAAPQPVEAAAAQAAAAPAPEAGGLKLAQNHVPKPNAMPPGAGMQVAQPAAPRPQATYQAAPTQAPPPPAAQQQPAPQAPPQSAQQAQQQPPGAVGTVPAQPQGGQGSLMRVESSSSVPQRKPPRPGSFPSADPQPTLRPRPTPKGRKSKKSAVLTGIIIVVSVAAGAVIGSFVLSIL